jgi:hypothetical protein
MDKQKVLKEIDRLYVNCRDHMKNIPDDWQKVYNALHRVYEKYGRDKWVLEQVMVTYDRLESYWKGIENVE